MNNNKDLSPQATKMGLVSSMEEKGMVSTNNEMNNWTQLAESLYEFLNSRNTTIEYSFVDMEVMVPKEIGLDAPQARWKLNGALRVRTWEG